MNLSINVIGGSTEFQWSIEYKLKLCENLFELIVGSKEQESTNTKPNYSRGEARK